MIGLVLDGVYVLVAAVLFVVAALTLSWQLYAWRRDDSLGELHVKEDAEPISPTDRLSFSLLFPARHEEEVLGFTLDQIAKQDYDLFEVIVIIGHDDPYTMAVAEAAAARHPDIMRVVVDYHEKKNKPRGLNTALKECTGDVIGVFDAEDVVHPDLLKSVERKMVQERCAALQAGVQLMNFWSSWYAARNVLEYYFWFRSRLHFQSHQGFIPLGGNTVFIRRKVMEAFGGWDGDCLAEDADLGVRLSSSGLKVSILYDPRIITREETPDTLKIFVKQRTRWNQGFIQVIQKGSWRQLPTRRMKIFALFTLSTPFIQSFNGVLAPVSLLSMALLTMPAPMALFAFIPIIPSGIAVVVDAIAIYEFGKLYDRPARAKDYARVVFGTPLFQMTLSFSAMRAVYRLYRGNTSWEKTAHIGAHLAHSAKALEQDNPDSDNTQVAA